jgi:hypothetical protein
VPFCGLVLSPTSLWVSLHKDYAQSKQLFGEVLEGEITIAVTAGMRRLLFVTLVTKDVVQIYDMVPVGRSHVE